MAEGHSGPTRFAPRANAILERCHQPDGLPVVLRVVHRGFDGFPGVVVELDALADHSGHQRLNRSIARTTP